MLGELPSAILTEIPDGPAGTRATLKLMGTLTKRGKTNPEIRSKAAALIQHLPQKDYENEVAAIFSFVQNRIRYVRDIRNVETVHYAEQILKQAHGDCDDKAILLASLLEAVGKPTRFVAVAFEPGHYSHVFTDVAYKRGWLSLDPTEPQPIGWRPPGIVQLMAWYN